MAGELSPALPKPSTVKDQSVIEAGKKDENTPEDFNMMDIDTQPELGVATTSTDNEQGTTMRGALPTPEDKGVGAAGSSAITPVPGVSGTAEPSEPTTFDEKYAAVETHDAPRGILQPLDDPEEQVAVYSEVFGEKKAAEMVDGLPNQPLQTLPQVITSPLNKPTKRPQSSAFTAGKERKRIKPTRRTKIKRILNPPKPIRDIYNWDREPRDPMEESKLKEIAKVQTSTKGVSFADFNTYVEEMHEQTGRPTDSYLEGLLNDIDDMDSANKSKSYDHMQLQVQESKEAPSVVLQRKLDKWNQSCIPQKVDFKDSAFKTLWSETGLPIEESWRAVISTKVPPVDRRDTQEITDSPSKSRGKGRAKRVTRGIPKDEHTILFSEKSPLIPRNIHRILEVGYKKLSKKRQILCRALLPDVDLVYRDGHNLPKLNPYFWIRNIPIKTACREYSEELGDGCWTKRYAEEAYEARYWRCHGLLDKAKDGEYESYWGQKQKLCSNIRAGDSTYIKPKMMMEHRLLKGGDIWRYSRNFGEMREPIVKECVCTSISIETGEMTFDVPSGGNVFVNPENRGFKVTVTTPSALENHILKVHPLTPQHVANGNAWKSFRIIRNDLDRGALWELRQGLHERLEIAKEKAKAENGGRTPRKNRRG